MAEVEFTEWTNKHHIRHPSFKRLRLDKRAKAVKREEPQPLAKIKNEDIPQKNAASSRKSTRKTLDFIITHPEKIIYPENKYTKQDLLFYYELVSDYILPFIKNRPLSLVRCPENYKECFFQRHYNTMMPKALKSIEIGAYSRRSRVHAPISVPLEWDELTHSQEDTNFNIKTLPTRLDSLKKEPWKEFWTIKQSLHLPRA